MILEGDGIGPEITKQAVKVLKAFNLANNIEYALIGGAAYEKYNDPLPQATLDLAIKSDAILLGAVAVGGMIFSCLYWSFGFLRMGTSGLTAQACGAADEGECAAVLGRSLICALFIAMVIMLLQEPIRALALSMTGNSSVAVLEHAGAYFDMRIWAAPATLSLYALNGWFLGMQNSMWPLFLAIFSNIVNMLLSYYLVTHHGMGAQGVALGTVCAQYVSLAAASIIILYFYRNVVRSVKWKKLTELTALRGFFTLNRDIFIRTLLLIFSVSFFTAKSADFGEEILAAKRKEEGQIKKMKTQ